MEKSNNYPVSISLFLGSGENGERLKENIDARTSSKISRADILLAAAKKGDPSLFKGVSDGKRK